MAMTLTCNPPSYSHLSPITPDVAFAHPSIDEGQFAFASIKGEVHLIQALGSPISVSSPLTTIDVKIFRHEFITIFRLVETTTLHPADIRILEKIDDRSKLHEEESGTVFLAKELMERLRKISNRGRSPQQTHPQFSRMRRRW